MPHLPFRKAEESCSQPNVSRHGRFFSDLLKAEGTARQIIASGDRDQKVQDDSTFRQLFIEAISGEVQGLGRDGFITASELGVYLRDRMTRLTALRASPQTPQADFMNVVGMNRGDLLFQFPGREAPKPPAAFEEGDRLGKPATVAVAVPPVNPVPPGGLFFPVPPDQEPEPPPPSRPPPNQRTVPSTPSPPQLRRSPGVDQKEKDRLVRRYGQGFYCQAVASDGAWGSYLSRGSETNAKFGALDICRQRSKNPGTCTVTCG